MGLISKIEAAMRLGVSVELIEYFTKNCLNLVKNTN